MMLQYEARGPTLNPAIFVPPHLSSQGQLSRVRSILTFKLQARHKQGHLDPESPQIAQQLD